MIKIKSSFLASICFLAIIASPALAKVSYHISLTLNPTAGEIKAVETITFTNDSKKELSELTLRVGPAYKGGIKLTSITDIRGTPLSTSRLSLTQISKMNARFINITLPSPLPPGGSYSIKITFKITDLSHNEYILLLDTTKGGKPCWYPRLVSWKNPWFRNRGDYLIEVTLPLGYTVISSGKAEQEGSSPRKLSSSKGDIRGFTLVIGKGMKKVSTESAGVRLNIYFQQGKKRFAIRAGTIASDIISYYRNRLGFFPGEEMEIVLIPKTDLEGEVAPGIIILNDSFEKLITDYGFDFALSFLRFELSYLLAREYFGEWLADPGNYIPWLTEGFSLFMSESYTRAGGTYLPTYKNYRDYYITAAEQGENTTLLRPIGEIKGKMSNWEEVLARGKGYAVIKMLAYLIGERKLWELGRKLLDRFPQSPPGYDELVALSSEVGGRDLSFFFNQWIKEENTLDYAIKRGELRKSGNQWQGSIEVVREGSASMPVKLTVLLSDGEKLEFSLKGEEKRESITFTAKAPPRRAELDPEQMLPDIARRNNYFFFQRPKRLGDILFPIDRVLDIGALDLKRDFKKEGAYLRDGFSLQIANKTNEPINVGLVIFSSFPGLRTKGKRTLFISLPPKGRRMINDYYLIPNGKGRARIEARFFLVRDQKELREKIRKGEKPALSLNNAVVIK